MKIKRTSSAKGQTVRGGTKAGRTKTVGPAPSAEAAAALHAAADALLQKSAAGGRRPEGTGPKRRQAGGPVVPPPAAHPAETRPLPGRAATRAEAPLGPPQNAALALSIVEMGHALATAQGLSRASGVPRRAKAARLAAQGFVDDPTVAHR